ncbi:uncharacterized protein LOC124850833 [Scophthalmus maximus]|uniref:uncharacterized protein LOC124850833 n=1 Tax=Scophthalmus maximus TaxID=52904 RepID=UPI001FA86DE2|nr:uncharacterized protein LOC124850833 [Scophthalmus maximus]
MTPSRQFLQGSTPTPDDHRQMGFVTSSTFYRISTGRKQETVQVKKKQETVHQDVQNKHRHEAGASPGEGSQQGSTPAPHDHRQMGFVYLDDVTSSTFYRRSRGRSIKTSRKHRHEAGASPGEGSQQGSTPAPHDHRQMGFVYLDDVTSSTFYRRSRRRSIKTSRVKWDSFTSMRLSRQVGESRPIIHFNSFIKPRENKQHYCHFCSNAATIK